MAALRDSLDAFFGRGRYSASVPVMDGPLQPNSALEKANVLTASPGLDNLVPVGESLLFTSGARLLRFSAQESESVEVWCAPAQISCLAVDSKGAVAAGIDGVGIDIRGGSHNGHQIRLSPSGQLSCPTAALFFDEDTLIVASGSARHKAADWKSDLMNRGASGTVWRFDLRTGKANLVGDRLAFPFGLARASGDDILVSEAWRHRIIRFGARPGVHVALGGLPGYPSRLVSATGGGYWLCLFAPRNQLIEFVLKERGYRRKMMASVHPDLWIAPSLASGTSFKEPLQGGAVKQMGILKPWAPARSHGLLVRLNSEIWPIQSWHSRADGSRHGVTSVCEFEGRLIAGAKGPGLALDLGLVHPHSLESF